MRAPRREDLRLAALIGFVVLGTAGLGGYVTIERDFGPRDGPFGLPARIVTCGRSYLGGEPTSSLAQIQAAIAPGYSPVVFEPVLGLLPLTAPFECHPARLASGATVVDTVVYLHTGPDTYAAYALEGGP